MQVVLASFYSAKKLRCKEVTAVVEEETPEPRLCCRFLVFIYFFFCIFFFFVFFPAFIYLSSLYSSAFR